MRWNLYSEISLILNKIIFNCPNIKKFVYFKNEAIDEITFYYNLPCFNVSTKNQKEDLENFDNLNYQKSLIKFFKSRNISIKTSYSFYNFPED